MFTHRLLLQFLLLTITFSCSVNAQSSFLNPERKPVPAVMMSDEDIIRHQLSGLEYGIRHKEVIRIIRLFDESIDLRTNPRSGTSRINPELFRVDSISIEINGPVANVQCKIAGIGNEKKPKERLIFKRTNGFWMLVGSTLLRELIADYLFGAPVGQKSASGNSGGEPSSVQQSSSSESSTRSFSLRSATGSPITSFTMSSRAVVRRHIPYTNAWSITRTTTQQQLERQLFDAPVDGAVIIPPGTSDFVAFVADQSWNRIVYGTLGSSAVRSYGDNPGDYNFLLPLALDASNSGSIYCIDGIRRQLFRLRYDNGTGLITFVNEITVPGLVDPVDLSLQGSSIWVADRSANAIVKITPNGEVLGRATRAIDYYTGTQYDFVSPSKVLAYSWSSKYISLIDSYGKRVLTIYWPMFDGDKIRGYVVPAEFSLQTNTYIVALGYSDNDGLWAVDRNNAMLHKLDISSYTTSGLLASVKLLSDGQAQWASPRSLASTMMSQSYPTFVESLTLDTWSDTRGINAYLPGADIIDFRVSYPAGGIQFEYKLTNPSILTSEIYNQSNQLVHQFASSEPLNSGRRVDAIQWSQLGSGSFTLRVSAVPLNNANYGEYQQIPTQITQAFSPPPTVSISGPTEVSHTCCKGQPVNRYTWNAVVSGGVPPYTYTWFMNGSDVGTNSSYTEYFSYNGHGGGSYQFALRVDVRDAANSTASASLVVTGYNSGGGGGIGIESIGELISETPLPSEFSMSQNYPNPFNPETQIVFGLPEPSHVTIVISDILGRQVLTLQEGELPARYHYKLWTGVDASSQKVGSGIYFCRISAKGESGKEFTKVMKLILLQ